jgi:excisionase family DNA binding protein
VTSLAKQGRFGEAIAGPPPDAVTEDELPGWPPGKTWGLARDVAAVLGCARQTVHVMRAAGRIRARAHGLRSWRFHRDEVLRLVRSRAVGEELAGAYGEGPAPVDRALHLLDALTPVERDRVGYEIARRRLETPSSGGGLAVVRGGRR